MRNDCLLSLSFSSTLNQLMNLCKTNAVSRPDTDILMWNIIKSLSLPFSLKSGKVAEMFLSSHFPAKRVAFMPNALVKCECFFFYLRLNGKSKKVFHFRSWEQSQERCMYLVYIHRSPNANSNIRQPNKFGVKTLRENKKEKTFDNNNNNNRLQDCKRSDKQNSLCYVNAE